MLAILSYSFIWTVVNGLQVGVLSDTHIKKGYNPKVGKPNYFCNDVDNEGKENPRTAEVAPLGRYYCDPPPSLVEEMFAHYAKVWGNPDVILFTGDHVAHYVAWNPKMKERKEEYTLYPLLKETLAT